MSIKYQEKYVVLLIGKNPNLLFVDAGEITKQGNLNVLFRGQTLKFFSKNQVKKALEDTKKFVDIYGYKWDKLFETLVVPINVPVKKNKKKKKNGKTTN